VTKYAFLRAGHQFHNGVLAFKDIRPWLIDGGHKMYKIPADKIPELNYWLKNENLPQLDDQPDDSVQISVEQAFQLVKIFWGKK
jgi:hypothetical protein